MSDATTPPNAGLETEQPPELKVYVDARCVMCKNVSVCNVPASGDWKLAGEKGHGACTFHERCHNCSDETPHNITGFLSGLNKKRDDAVEVDH